MPPRVKLQSNLLPGKKTKDTDTVDTPSVSYIEMVESGEWLLINDLMAGTRAMRFSGEQWLPIEPKETRDAYDNRLERSFLYGGYSDTVDKLTAKPFSKPVSLKNPPTQEMLAEVEEDVDQTGTNLTQFTRALFKIGLRRGLCHILIDFPSTVGELSLAEERQLEIRPRFIAIDPWDLIGWKTGVALNGVPQLTQIRIREERIVNDGKFADTKEHWIRVYNVETWEMWKLIKNDDEKCRASR